MAPELTQLSRLHSENVPNLATDKKLTRDELSRIVVRVHSTRGPMNNQSIHQSINVSVGDCGSVTVTLMTFD